MALTDALGTKGSLPPPGGLSPVRLLGRWQEALTDCLPSRLRSILVPRDQRVTLIPLGDRATLCRGEGDARAILGDIDPGSPGPILRSLLSSAKRENRGTRIEVPGDRVISRTVYFPIQVRKNLSQVVAYEIDRLTPFHPDQVCFDFRPVDALSKGEKLAVEIALCRRDLIRNWIEHLRNAGSPVEEVTWEGAWPRANLLPAAERPQGGARYFSTSRLMLLLVLCLTAAVLVGPIWQKNRILERQESDLSELKGQAEDVYEVRSAIERARRGSVAVLERKSEQPLIIDLLNELTQRLGDDTWIQNLDYRNGEVQIRGESSQAASLIGLLEQAPGSEQVAFRSPVVQVATTGKERFHIAFRYTRVNPAP